MGKILIIVLLLIVALLGLGFGWVTYNDKVALEARQAEQAARVAELEEKADRLGQETSAALAGQERADSRAAQAQEAARMAQELAARAEAEKQAQLKALNAQLEAAAQERQRAVAQAKQLADRMTALEEARQVAAQRLAELEQARNQSTGATGPGGLPIDAEASELSAKLAEQEAQLEQLREENLALNARAQELLAEQIAAEEAIVAAGGEFHSTTVEIMSPSAKRYMAQRHRARREADSPNP
jgi:DNA repair exonuclease SbcCD ATPase subunit